MMMGVLMNGFVSFSVCFEALSHCSFSPFQFHLPCVGLKQPPPEKWYCSPSCAKNKGLVTASTTTTTTRKGRKKQPDIVLFFLFNSASLSMLYYGSHYSRKLSLCFLPILRMRFLFLILCIAIVTILNSVCPPFVFDCMHRMYLDFYLRLAVWVSSSL